jgi:WD40 repeat protein
MSRHPGQRIESLRSIKEAMQLPLPPGRSLDELRTEAIAALALPDLEILQEWEGLPTNVICWDFDANLGHYAWLATDGTVSVRRVSDNAEIYHWQERTQGAWSQDGSSLRFSPDGRYLGIWHSTSGRVIVRQLDGPEPPVCHEGNKAGAGLADFSPDSKWLAYCLVDSRIAIVDLASREVLKLPPTGAEQSNVCFAPDGHRFALVVRRASQWAIEVREAATGRVQQTLLHPKGVGQPAWHPDGRTLATCCEDHLIRLWDVPSGRLLRTLEGHKALGMSCTFTRTGDRLLSNDWSCVLRVWEASSGRQLLSFPGGSYWVSPDDRVSVISIPNRSNLQVLRLSPGLEYRTIDLGGSNAGRGLD